MLAAILAVAGTGTATGGSEEAAQMLDGYSWSDSTWKNRLSKLRKWMKICEENGRSPMPATEGDFIAFIGYLSLNVKVGTVSARQYVTDILRYHEDGGFNSDKDEADARVYAVIREEDGSCA